MSARTFHFQLGGGEDLISPAMVIDPGRLTFSLNYETALGGGYKVLGGYERYDGQSKPSNATYAEIPFTSGTREPSLGSTITGATSTATSYLHEIRVDSGSWAGNDAEGTLVVFAYSYVDDGSADPDAGDEYNASENLNDGSGVFAVTNGATTVASASTDALHWQYLIAARAYIRTNIGAVPGSGNIRGVWVYNGVVYAFRDNGVPGVGTKCVMYKATDSGWTICDFGYRLDFDTGSAEFAEYEVVSQGGASATVRRVVVTSGSWGGGDAAGFLVIYGLTGNFAAGAITGSISGAANATGVQIENIRQPEIVSVGGTDTAPRYEFINENFGGDASTIRMYGVDGQNPAFEWDGTTYTPIDSALTTDKPQHIAANKSHLFLSRGSSVVHSAPGLPYDWTALSGASEILVGDTCVGFLSISGDAFGIPCRNRTHVLYGSSVDDWVLSTISDNTGAIEWTLQSMQDGRYLDDRGLTGLTAVQEYGNFRSGSFSSDVQPLIEALAGLSQSSVKIAAKDQYRIFYSNNTGLCCTFQRGKAIGITRIDYGIAVRATCSGEDSEGREIVLFAADDDTGYVYEMDSGTSFDGAAFDAYLRPPFNNIGNPNEKVRFLKAIVEADTPEGITIEATAEYSYGDGDIPRGTTRSLDVNPSGALWDVDAVWSQFVWSGGAIGNVEVYLDGTGTSLGLVIHSTNQHRRAHTLRAISIDYLRRGRKR